MLGALVEELRSRGIGLLIARDVGQFRDIAAAATGNDALRTRYPTIDAAVEAARRT
jgi:hypothetical protein